MKNTKPYCLTCKNQGFIDSSYIKDGREYPVLAICFSCKDKEKYNIEVKKRYGNKKESEQEKVNRLLGRD